MCSRYSCSSVHSSPTGLHVGFALQRQQGGEGGGWLGGDGGRGGEGGGWLCAEAWLSLRVELTPPSADTLAEPWGSTPLLARSSGGAFCSRRVLLKWLPRPAAPKASIYWLLSGRAPKARSVAPTSKPPTVKLPSTSTVSVCSVRVGAVLEQPAACVTLRGVSTAATAAEPLDRVVLELTPSNCHAQFSASLPRHEWTSSKWCVVVLCSRYSCSLVHSSPAGLHVLLAVQRQQGGGAAGGGAATEGVAPMSRNACATSKPPTVKLPSTTVSICSDKVGAVPEQSAACVTLRGVGTATTVVESLDSVVLELAGSNCHAQLAGSLPRHASTCAKWCVVVLCSRYSCSSEHLSTTGLHVGSAAQRQQADAEYADPRRRCSDSRMKSQGTKCCTPQNACQMQRSGRPASSLNLLAQLPED
eukprot:scaffold76184_cov48-Phaeocystis_antarctica.AAC.2